MNFTKAPFSIKEVFIVTKRSLLLSKGPYSSHKVPDAGRKRIVPKKCSHLLLDAHLEVEEPPVLGRELEQVLLLPRAVQVVMDGRRPRRQRRRCRCRRRWCRSRLEQRSKAWASFETHLEQTWALPGTLHRSISCWSQLKLWWTPFNFQLIRGLKKKRFFSTKQK